jgi:hypothetical protein
VLKKAGDGVSSHDGPLERLMYMWFVTQDSDTLRRFRADMSCLYGRCVSILPL